MYFGLERPMTKAIYIAKMFRMLVNAQFSNISYKLPKFSNGSKLTKKLTQKIQLFQSC